MMFRDTMLVACARGDGCTLVLSEAFQHGRTLDGVHFYSPFVEPIVDDRSSVSLFQRLIRFYNSISVEL